MSVRAAFVAALLVLFSTVPAAGAPLLDPGRAKAADGCQRALAKGAAKFMAATLKNLEQCYDGLFTCVQTKPGIPACVDKARAKCVAAADVKAPAARAALTAAVAKKCASVADLKNPDGLGYDALVGTCPNPLDDVAAVAECVRGQHECVAEQMFMVEMPRAAQLAAGASLALRAGSCLQDLGGGGDVGDATGLGKAVDKCQRAIKKAGAKLVAAKLKALGACVTTAFGCLQTKPGEPKCTSKTQQTCDKALDVTLAAAETKAAAALEKPCRPIFADLEPATALNLGALAAVCQTVGVAGLTTLDDFARCVVRQHGCVAAEQFRFAAPRAEAILHDVGHELRSAACGPTPTPTATVTPPPTTTASPTSTTTATPTLSATPTATLSPTPTEEATETPVPTATPVMLSVSFLGAGTGTVTVVPGGTVCGATCSVGVIPGGIVTLQARTTNGSGSHFQGFAGAGCGTERDCSLLVNGDINVDATFAANDANLVFLTSGFHLSDLGGALAYDQACNTVATAAGLNDVGGDAYVAWVSDSSSNASARLGSARGFVRLDGRPIADTVASLLAGAILNPIRIDETGRDFGNVSVSTGTAANGVASLSNCSDWSSTSGAEAIGRSADGPDSWTFFNDASCSDRQIYCFMKTSTTPLVTTPNAGKLIFTSTTPFVPGSDPDAHCENEKPPGTGTVAALLARSTSAASTHLDAGTTYVRPDGQVVGTGQQLIDTGAGSALLETGAWQAADDSYATRFIWIGADDLTTVPSASATCNDWTQTTGTARVGRNNTTIVNAFSNATLACSATNTHLYCVEQ